MTRNKWRNTTNTSKRVNTEKHALRTLSMYVNDRLLYPNLLHFLCCVQGGLKYFCIGYILEIVRTTLPRLPQTLTNFSRLMKALFNKENVKFGLFFGGYVAVYRVSFVNCKKWQCIVRERTIRNLGVFNYVYF